MKKNLLALLLAVLLLLTAGCGMSAGDTAADSPSQAITEATAPATAEPEAPSPNPSDNAEEPTYTPESLSQLPELSDGELVLYATGSDGAYAEGAGYELYKRFVRDPGGILTQVSKLKILSQERVCAVLVGEVVIGERCTEFEAVVASLPSSDMLSLLKEKYAAIAPAHAPEPDDSDFVEVSDYIPSIIVELKYATDDNFVGRAFYDFTDAYLRYGTVKKLAEVQSELAESGYGLKIWDAFRPVSAQFTLWEIMPDAQYVANLRIAQQGQHGGCDACGQRWQ